MAAPPTTISESAGRCENVFHVDSSRWNGPSQALGRTKAATTASNTEHHSHTRIEAAASIQVSESNSRFHHESGIDNNSYRIYTSPNSRKPTDRSVDQRGSKKLR